VEDAIALDGGKDALPQATQDGLAGVLCISYHARGPCYGHCTRVATHTLLSAAEAPLFHALCDIAFA
jgi:hypothetical protein